MTKILRPISTGAEVILLLEGLKEESSTLVKQSIVNDYIDAPLFRAVCRWALDPFITFGVTKWSQPHWHSTMEITVNHNNELEPARVQKLLVGLSTRTLTGHRAQAEITATLELLTPKSAELLERILGRSLKCKVTKTIINKASPGLIPTFDVMRAYEYEEKRVKKFPVYSEEKFDGVRLVCFVDTLKNTVKFFSRSGIPFTNLEHLEQSMLDLASHANLEVGAAEALEWVFDGEVLAGAFNKTVGDIRRQKEQAVDAIFHVFDLMPRYMWDTDTENGDDYYNRSTLLFNIMTNANLPGLQLVESTPVHSHEEIQLEYQKVRDQGGEGVIIKLGDGMYQRKKSRNWLKIKAKETVDAIITDTFEGQKKYTGKLGGVIVVINDVEVRVGGGFTDPQRDELYTLGGCPIGRMIEIEYHEKTPDGSLRHPRFVGFRDDKHLPENEA